MLLTAIDVKISMFPLFNTFFLIFSIYSFIKAINIENKPEFRFGFTPELKLLDIVSGVMRSVFPVSVQSTPREMLERH